MAIFNHMTREEIMEAIESMEALTNFHKDWGVKIPQSWEEVLQEVALAQVASDGGKGLDRFKAVNGRTEAAYAAGYADKDDHILSAILGIEALGGGEVDWFISSTWEEYWHIFWYADEEDNAARQMDSIIYFEWKGQQISFHSFSLKWKEVRNSFGCKTTEWDEGSSPLTCLHMMEAAGWSCLATNNLEIVSRLDPKLEAACGLKEVPGDYARGLDPRCGVAKRYFINRYEEVITA